MIAAGHSPARLSIDLSASGSTRSASAIRCR